MLPHEPVFADDAAARRALVGASDLVLAHSPAALAALADLGAVPRRSAVIRHGPVAAGPAAALRPPGAGGGPRRFLFFGRVQPYKGVEDLLAAFAALPGDVAAQLTMAGQCDDPRLRPACGRWPGAAARACRCAWSACPSGGPGAARRRRRGRAALPAGHDQRQRDARRCPMAGR